MADPHKLYEHLKELGEKVDALTTAFDNFSQTQTTAFNNFSQTQTTAFDNFSQTQTARLDSFAQTLDTNYLAPRFRDFARDFDTNYLAPRFDSLARDLDTNYLAPRFDSLARDLDTNYLAPRFASLARDLDTNYLAPRFDAINNRIDEINMTINPLMRPCVQRAPLASGGALLTDETNGVFTWFRMDPTTPPFLIGSAHTALRYKAKRFNSQIPSCGKFLNFVSLPDEVLAMGVNSIALPDVKLFQNPLPTEMDVCAVHVNGPQPADCPSFHPVTTVVGVREEASNVVGKSVGGYVSSLGGAVGIQMSQNGMGQLHFLLAVGEPGDSGTLLYMKDSWPIAIFSGYHSLTTVHQKRGKACVIPPAAEFRSKLDVVPFGVLASWNLQWVQLEGAPDAASIYNIRQISGNIVELVNTQNTLNRLPATIRGVFVYSDSDINFAGDKDIDTMYSYGQPWAQGVQGMNY